MKLKTIDLCAGIGGIRRGFELAGGYRNIASAEIDEMACKTYEHLFHEDPRNDVTNEKFKKHLQTLHYDVLMAGFPCQAFSSVGLQHGFEDKTKGTIFFDIAKIIKMTRPKVVFLENVQNLLSHDKQATFKTIVFHRLLDEQAGILDFLDEQLTAAVNGAAGTGKTMIAVEKARRHAAAGERVLFLCFNAQLKDFLEENYARDLVSYYTIAGFACKICNTVKPNYDELREKLEDYYISDSFPYKHVIIDEGQDFGIEAIEETDIIQLIHDIIVGLDQGGTFYVFYDRLQLIQAKEMPKFIGDLDCRLTLYRNCRNTENIAVTSLRPITERKPKVFEGTVKGAPARIHFCDSVQNERERIDSIIDNLAADGYRDVVLLTCKTEATSILSDSVNNGRYRNKYLFTTCRKFKGLEADVVILLDVDKATFEQENVLIFYVGTSRARIKLEITAILSDDDCKEILTSVLNYQGKIRRAKKDFAGALNAIGCLET